MTERLARLIARTGLASRREAEKLVSDGRVRIDGVVATEPGRATDPASEEIKVDGRPLPRPPPAVYYLLHKPRGIVTTRKDPQGRKSVEDLLCALPFRVEPVGRLDINTEGALLLTNDGELARALTLPASGVPRRYLAKVWRTPTESTLRRIESGIRLEDGRTGPCKARVVEVTDGGNAWVELTVTEGRNHLVRRMLEAVGHPVSKLKRESFATISCRGLEPGQLRPLAPAEVDRLRDLAGGTPASVAGHRKRYGKGYARPKADRRRGSRRIRR